MVEIPEAANENRSSEERKLAAETSKIVGEIEWLLLERRLWQASANDEKGYEHSRYQ